MSRTLTIGSFLLLLLSSRLLAAEIPENHWAAIVGRDLQFIHDELAANHPGAIDEQNDEFGLWLKEGFKQALEKSRDAESLAAVNAILRYYIAGFADGHTNLDLYYQPKWIRWSGFVPARFRDQYLVHYTASDWPETLPPAGAEIVECDGRPIDNILTDDLLPYRDGRSMLESVRVRHTPRLFTRNDAKVMPELERCTFVLDEQTIELPLSWGWIPSGEMEELITKAAQRSSGSIEQREISPGIHWIRLPTFRPEGEELETMKEIVASINSLRDAKKIVFDVRGNGGGSSVWGSDLTRNLFGDLRYRWAECMQQSESFAVWRVSEKNAEHVADLEPKIREHFGEDSEVYEIFSQLREELEQGLEDGVIWIRQPRSSAEKEKTCPPSAPPNLVEATVILLTDAACASACLDFADEILSMPGVIHAGAPTSADTVYMEVRDVMLPSRLGQISVAMKVYRNRARGHNEPYLPQYWYDGDLSDTESLQEWIRTIPGPHIAEP